MIKNIPSTFPHVMYHNIEWEDKDDYGVMRRRRGRTKTINPEVAEIVSSELRDRTGRHAPCLDIDIPAQLVPSSTQGHSHLYIDTVLTWRQYKRLLKALMKANIIEKGYYGASKRRKSTHLRVPWVRKSAEQMYAEAHSATKSPYV